jgi:hypothetical protein
MLNVKIFSQVLQICQLHLKLHVALLIMSVSYKFQYSCLAFQANRPTGNNCTTLQTEVLVLFKWDIPSQRIVHTNSKESTKNGTENYMKNAEIQMLLITVVWKVCDWIKLFSTYFKQQSVESTEFINMSILISHLEQGVLLEVSELYCLIFSLCINKHFEKILDLRSSQMWLWRVAMPCGLPEVHLFYWTTQHQNSDRTLRFQQTFIRVCLPTMNLTYILIKCCMIQCILIGLLSL